MLKDYLRRLKKEILPILGLMLLLLAIGICLTGCASQQVVVPQQRQEVPQSLTQKALPDAEAFCSEVQAWLNEVASYMGDAPQDTMR